MILARPNKQALVKPLVLLSMVAALVALLGLSSSDAAATRGPHPPSETPGSDEAILYTPFFNDRGFATNIALVAEAVRDHGYRVNLNFGDNTGDTDNNPGTATAENFKSVLLGTRGILFVVTHGGTDRLVVEARDTAANCTAAVTNYVNTGVFQPGQIECVGDRLNWLAITDAGVRAYYRDNETIVHLDACSSFTLADDFVNARELFGYEGTVQCIALLVDTGLLWGRLHGKRNEGECRWAAVAYACGGYDALFKHKPGRPLDTVLSPAVAEHEPPKGKSFVVPTSTPGYVRFDTKMDTTVDPTTVMSVEGCVSDIVEEEWASPFILTFTLILKFYGDATLTVHQDKARAGRDFKNYLDGNTVQRAGTDHVGPNRDDFKWTVKCTDDVGGIVELVSAPPDFPRSQADSSGAAASPAVVLAAGVAALGAALAASVWYARRSWSRP